MARGASHFGSTAKQHHKALQTGFARLAEAVQREADHACNVSAVCILFSLRSAQSAVAQSLRERVAELEVPLLSW